MEDLLHWAVQNSDPERLKEVIAKYKDSNLTLKDVYGQETMDALFFDEYALVRDLIRQAADFRNASLPDENLEAVLARLEEFAEQIDNAGNLHRMGGLAPLVDLGLDDDPLRPSGRPSEVRVQALLTLGVAVQNNPPVQEDLLSLDGLRRLAARLPACGGGHSAGPAGASSSSPGEAGAPKEGAQVCGKLLYVLSGLVKNNGTIQADAGRLGVFDWLLGPGAAHGSLAVAKKSMGLLETVLAQSPELPFLAGAPAEGQASAAAALLAHVRGATGAEEGDTDVPEKALRLVSRLLSIRPMLFPAGFQQELADASAVARKRCEGAFGPGDELCEGLAGLASHCHLMLTARDISDDEL